MFRGFKHIKVEMLVRLGARTDNFTLYKYVFSNTQHLCTNNLCCGLFNLILLYKCDHTNRLDD